MYLAGIRVPAWQTDKLGEVRVGPIEFSSFIHRSFDEKFFGHKAQTAASKMKLARDEKTTRFSCFINSRLHGGQAKNRTAQEGRQINNFTSLSCSRCRFIALQRARVPAPVKSGSTGTGNTCHCREQFSLLVAGFSPSATALTASETAPTKINSDSSVGVADTSLCGRSVGTLTRYRLQGK